MGSAAADTSMQNMEAGGWRMVLCGLHFDRLQPPLTVRLAAFGNSRRSRRERRIVPPCAAAIRQGHTSGGGSEFMLHPSIRNWMALPICPHLRRVRRIDGRQRKRRARSSTIPPRWRRFPTVRSGRISLPAQSNGLMSTRHCFLCLIQTPPPRHYSPRRHVRRSAQPDAEASQHVGCGRQTQQARAHRCSHWSSGSSGSVLLQCHHFSSDGGH